MMTRTGHGAPGLFLATVLAFGLCGSAAAQHHNRHDERALKEDPRLAPGQIAPVLEGLGDHQHPVTTQSERAQMFFDQGLKLTYGFNHQEALRAFKEAARLDPDCAMAYWGWALVLGPNLNLPMQAEAAMQAFEAIQMALERRDGVSRPERLYIEALAKRYSDDPEADRAALNAAYADAMRSLHRKYPDDTDAATLFAAALMNQSPWNYWSRDGRPRERTPEILATLESAIRKDPGHEGALHYYIHTVEPVDPGRGEQAADRLRGLTPGAGHLVHMPSHIYMPLGRFQEAYESNVLAVEADEGYLTQCRAQGIYPLGYYPHNIHFLAWAAIMQGRSTAAVDAARKVASKVPADLRSNDFSLYQTFLSMPLYVLVRFGKWEAILEEPRPSDETIYWTAIWHYARGMAFTHTGQVKKARRELSALDTISDDPGTRDVMVGFAGAGTLLAIAREVLSGEIAARRGRYDEALGHLERAVRLEDSLKYTEPPDWYFPVRHILGAVLLEAGRPVEAEAVYWQDLRENRENGYALFGLIKSLKAQDKVEEAARVEARFRAAWNHADMELSSSRF